MGTTGRLAEGKWGGGSPKRRGGERMLGIHRKETIVPIREMWFSCMGTRIFSLFISE